jgi:uncharacterized membrane protein
MIIKHRLRELPPLGPVCASLGVASLLLAPLAALGAPDEVPGTDAIVAIVVLGIACTSLAFLAFFALIAAIGPGRASVITYVNPVIAVALGVTLLGERPGPAALAGLLLVLAGSWLATGGRLPPGAQDGPLGGARRPRGRGGAAACQPSSSKLTGRVAVVVERDGGRRGLGRGAGRGGGDGPGWGRGWGRGWVGGGGGAPAARARTAPPGREPSPVGLGPAAPRRGAAAGTAGGRRRTAARARRPRGGGPLGVARPAWDAAWAGRAWRGSRRPPGARAPRRSAARARGPCAAGRRPPPASSDGPLSARTAPATTRTPTTTHPRTIPGSSCRTGHLQGARPGHAGVRPLGRGARAHEQPVYLPTRPGAWTRTSITMPARSARRSSRRIRTVRVLLLTRWRSSVNGQPRPRQRTSTVVLRGALTAKIRSWIRLPTAVPAIAPSGTA